MANAKTPDETKKAQQRLMGLMEKMARREQQLQDVKVRHIDEAPVMKLKEWSDRKSIFPMKIL